MKQIFKPRGGDLEQSIALNAAKDLYEAKEQAMAAQFADSSFFEQKSLFETTENLNEKTPTRPRRIIKNAGIEVILSVSKKPVYTDTERI